MWMIEDAVNNSTNKVIVPRDGTITISKPDTVRVNTYVNDALLPTEQVPVKAGDTVYFKLTNYKKGGTPIGIKYEDVSDVIMLPGKIPSAGTSSKLIETTEEDDMTPAETINLFANPMGGAAQGGAMGTGLGAGLVGGLLGTALFGRRGLDGLDGGGVAPGAAVSVSNDMAIMQTLGDIKASIPLAESQVQLALAGAQMDLNNSISQGTGSVIGSISGFQSTVMNNLNMQSQMNQKGFTDNAAITVAQGNANMIATKDAATQALQSSWLLTQAITNDGDKTRALIQSIDKSNDSRTITTLANEISDLKNSRNLDAATGNITISNNNNATAIAQQQQAQQQQQLQYQILSQLGILAGDLQTVKQGQVIFNSGAMTGSATQAAANTKVA